MNKTKIIGAILLTMGMTGSVAAANGFYAGASIGKSSVDLCGDFFGITCDDEDTGWKIFGGYNLSRNLGFEASWADLGEVSVSGGGVWATAESDAIAFSVKGMLPLNEQFGVFGKIGLAFWDYEEDSNLFGPWSDDGTGLMFGIGAEYAFSNQFGVRGEWERFDIEDEDVDLLSIGAVIKF